MTPLCPRRSTRIKVSYSNTYTTGPLTVDSAGNVFFNVIQLAPFSDFYQADVIVSWLVRVAPDDTVQKVSYTNLTAGAPRGTDLCLAVFSDLELPWPPSL